MNPQDLIIRRISLNRFISERVVKYVATHPFLFTKQRMADPEDDRPIRIRYFGVFQQKKTHNKASIKRRREVVNLIKENEEHYLELFKDKFSTRNEIIAHIDTIIKYTDREEFNEFCDFVVNNKC